MAQKFFLKKWQKKKFKCAKNADVSQQKGPVQVVAATNSLRSTKEKYMLSIQNDQK